MLHFKEKNSQF